MMSRYKQHGWFKESWRHSLAAKGIKSNNHFFAKKKSGFSDVSDAGSPIYNTQTSSSASEVGKKVDDGGTSGVTKLKNLLGEQAFESATRRIIEEDRPENQALRAAREGRFNATFGGKSVLSYAAENPAIADAIRLRAMQNVQAGLPVDPSIKGFLKDKDVAQAIKDIKKQKEIERPVGPWSAAMTDASRAGLTALADVPGKAGSAIKDIYTAESKGTFGDEEVKTGFMERINKIPETSFFQYNAFLDEPGSPGYNKEDGGFDTWSDKANRTSIGDELFYDVVPNDNLKGLNNIKKPVAADVRTRADDTQEKVDSLFNAKDAMGKADISAFEKGTMAFKKGDREGVMAAITDLEKESSRLKDNWRMTEQVRAGVVDPVNVESAFNKKDGLFSSGGGAKLADQSKKVSEVKEEIMKSNNEVAARKKMLQYRLQRMDASVKPETDVPKEVDRFSEGTISKGIGANLNQKGVFKLDTAKEVFNVKAFKGLATSEKVKMKVEMPFIKLEKVEASTRPYKLSPMQIERKKAMLVENPDRIPDEVVGVDGKVIVQPAKGTQYASGTEKYYARKFALMAGKPWFGSVKRERVL